MKSSRIAMWQRRSAERDKRSRAYHSTEEKQQGLLLSKYNVLLLGDCFSSWGTFAAAPVQDDSHIKRINKDIPINEGEYSSSNIIYTNISIVLSMTVCLFDRHKQKHISYYIDKGISPCSTQTERCIYLSSNTYVSRSKEKHIYIYIYNETHLYIYRSRECFAKDSR